MLRYQKPKHDKIQQLKTELDRIQDDGRGKYRTANSMVSKQKTAKDKPSCKRRKNVATRKIS